ncbi:MAG: hypothetical protein HQK50_11050 [Oligoflexia bacterium]|nr:hypothetical protein [Oligoflexia bacterium]MBF0366100.1 hypothetical protein [Oligoflexia bacterium]
MKIVIFFLALSFIAILDAECVSASKGQYAEADFDFHPIAGCPENSLCTKAMGEKRIAWNKLIDTHNNFHDLEKYRREHGILVEVWTTLENPVEVEGKPLVAIATWESPCAFHRGKTSRKIYTAETFISSKNKIPEELRKEIFFRPFLLAPISEKDASVKIKMFHAPLDGSLLILSGGKLKFLRETNGIYYLLVIDDKESWEIVANDEKQSPREEVECYPWIVKVFEEKLNANKIYEKAICYKITDIKTKSVYLLLTVASCRS